MTYRSHSDETLEAVFSAALTRQDALGPIAREFGVSESLVSRMRVRAERLRAETGPSWSERSIRKQLLKDGWIMVRRDRYQLPARPVRWKLIAIPIAATAAVMFVAIPAARMVL